MIGQVIHNYRIEKLLGEGGMGVVYKGLDMTLQRPVAIKLLHSHLTRDSVFFDRFKNEAILLAHLSHPNVTTLYNFFSEGDQNYMVMEYVEGMTLEDYIEKHGSQPVEFVLKTMSAAADGLAHAHERGVLHRDIKPSNIMISKNGTVKIMDFGIAKMKGSTSMTRVGSVIGTLEYIAPELLSGKVPSPQSDLYAMGVVIYELLSGKLPFEGPTEASLINNIINQKPKSIKSLNPEVPKSLENTLENLLHKNSEKRLASADELKLKLDQIRQQWGKPAKVDTFAGLDKILKSPFKNINVLKGGSEESKPAAPSKDTSLEKTFLQKVLTPEGYMIIGGLILAVIVILFGTIDFNRKKDDNIALGDISKISLNDQSTVKNTDNTVNFPQDIQVVNSPQDEEKKEDKKKEDKTRQEDKKKEAPKNEPKTPVNNKPDETVKIVQDPVPAKPEEHTVIKEPEKRETTPRLTKKNIYVNNLAVELALNSDVSSDDPKIKDKRITFRVVYDIVKDGVNIIPSGSLAEGRVLKAKSSTSGKSSFLEIQPETVQAINGQKLRLKTPSFGKSSTSGPVIFTKGTRISPNPKIQDNTIIVEI